MNTETLSITNPEAKAFINTFLGDKKVNRDFFERVPEDKLDYHMVDTPERKSDSPRESIAHIIHITRKYIYGAKAGILTFDGMAFKKIEDPVKMSKQELLDELDNTTKELIELLSDPNISTMMVKVPWSTEPIPMVQSL